MGIRKLTDIAIAQLIEGMELRGKDAKDTTTRGRHPQQRHNQCQQAPCVHSSNQVYM